MQPRRRRPSIIHGRLLNRCYLARIMPLKIREPGFRKLWCFGGRIPAVSTVLFVGDERHRLLVRPTSTRNLIAFEATSWGTPRWISPSVRVMEGLGKWRERISEARLLPFRWSVWNDERLWRFNKRNNAWLGFQLFLGGASFIIYYLYSWKE